MPNPIQTIILCMFLLLTPVTTYVNPTLPTITKQEQTYVLQQYECLKEVLHFESRSEGTEGMKAVLSVVINRTNHKNYPDSYCAVIQQSRQFSYRNHLRKGQMMPMLKKPYNAIEQKVATQVSTLAFEAAVGSFRGILDPSVVMYHSIKMKSLPYWSYKYKKYVRIGNHQFYRS